MEKDFKILVTGGAGYIGSHTVVELQQQGFPVVIVDNLSNSRAFVIDRIAEITGVAPEFHRFDLADREKTAEFFASHKELKAVIHFAAFKAVGESMNEPLKYYRNNLAALVNVLQGMRDAHVENLVFSSSCTIYGQPDELPVRETSPVKEAWSPYANTKQMSEQIIRFTSSAFGFRSIALRYFNPVGAHPSGLNGELSPDKPNNLMPIITQVGIGKLKQMTVFGTDYNTRDGSCIRDYIHVSDIANAHVKALQFLLEKKNSSNYEIFNLGSGSGVTVLEMIKSFEETTGVKLNCILGDRRAGDVPAIFSDSTRANKLLKWECQYGIEDIVKSAWKWEKFLQNE